jgi:hypothetical protein
MLARSADRRRGRTVRVMALAAVLGALLSTILAMPAEAWTRTNQGCPGSVANDPVTATGGNGLPFSDVVVDFHRRAAYRNPCAGGVQWIRATYKVYEFSLDPLGWVKVRQHATDWVRVKPGYFAWLEPWGPSLSYGVPYSVTMKVRWLNRYGNFSGSSYMDFNMYRDYECGYVCHHWWRQGYGFGVMMCAPCYSDYGGVIYDE